MVTVPVREPVANLGQSVLVSPPGPTITVTVSSVDLLGVPPSDALTLIAYLPSGRLCLRKILPLESILNLSELSSMLYVTVLKGA